VLYHLHKHSSIHIIMVHVGKAVGYYGVM